MYLVDLLIVKWTVAVAHKQPTSPVVNICGLPVSGSWSWSFRGIDWTVMVVGVLLLRARRPGIRCQTVFVIQLWLLAFLGVSWKHTFFAKYWRDVISALEIFYENALRKMTLYLLAYFTSTADYCYSIYQCCWLWHRYFAVNCIFNELFWQVENVNWNYACMWDNRSKDKKKASHW